MKIIKIGGFNKQGFPAGWHFDLEGETPEEQKIECCLCLHSDGRVFVGGREDTGVEVVEWTEKRRKAMEGSTNVSMPDM